MRWSTYSTVMVTVTVMVLVLVALPLAASGKKLYYCPMHPHVKSEQPGSCSICGMDLVLRTRPAASKSKASSAKAIKISPVRQQMIGIKLEKVRKRKLFKSIFAPGRIAFDPELYTAQSEYLQALAQWKKVRRAPLSQVRKNTRQMIRSSEIRLKVLGLSQQQIAQLARRGGQSEGLLVSGKGQDNWVYADVFEVDLAHIKSGMEAHIRANFLQGKVLRGEVASVDQVINARTRTAKVRIKLREPLRPGSYVDVTILLPLGEHLSVSLEALLYSGNEAFVFVKKGAGIFVPVKVPVLQETEHFAAIAADSKLLAEGAEVVVGGNFMLDSESRLQSIIGKQL